MAFSKKLETQAFPAIYSIRIMSNLTTIRRLSDDDVRAVFESLHNNHKPPPYLHFQIVRVGPNGLKLSPPSYEFEDGLYILLKPEKKKKSRDGGPSHPQTTVPSELTSLLLQETPPASCPWSLSGPQFPQPTAIQQRYCYPKGDPEYSSRKGGALWTMYGADGNENLEYRLLHVYFSAKRAVNKGFRLSPAVALSAASTPSRPIKRAKKTSPPKKRNSLATPERRPARSQQLLPQSPVLSFDLTEGCLSPMAMPSYHAAYGPPHVPAEATKFVTPQSSSRGPDNAFEHPFHPVGDQPSPFRPRVLDASSSIDDPIIEKGDAQEDSDATSMDPFPWEDSGETIKELENACWDEPLFVPPLAERKAEGEEDHDQNESIQQFADRLKRLQESFTNQILSAKQVEQGPLLSLLSSWARQIAQDPLSGSAKQITEV